MRISLPLSKASRLEASRLLLGFTLVEILVACAVLALVVAVLASLFSNFAGLTRASGKRLETGNQSRTVFDRMAFDLNSSIRNGGVEVSFLKNAQATGGGGASFNDSMLFLADTRTSSADSRLARVGYEVGESTNAAAGMTMTSLLRCAEPFLWTDSTTQIALGADADCQPLGQGVFRMELCFLKTDGTITATPPAAEEIAAVVCTTAALDEGTFAKLSASQRATLVASLPDAVDGRLPLSDWSVDKFSSLPASVRQNVRFNQRYFYLQ